jgi:hypothetical protein
MDNFIFNFKNRLLKIKIRVVIAPKRTENSILPVPGSIYAYAALLSSAESISNTSKQPSLILNVSSPLPNLDS